MALPLQKLKLYQVPSEYCCTCQLDDMIAQHSSMILPIQSEFRECALIPKLEEQLQEDGNHATSQMSFALAFGRVNEDKSGVPFQIMGSSSSFTSARLQEFEQSSTASNLTLANIHNHINNKAYSNTSTPSILSSTIIHRYYHYLSCAAFLLFACCKYQCISSMHLIDASHRFKSLPSTDIPRNSLTLWASP